MQIFPRGGSGRPGSFPRMNRAHFFDFIVGNASLKEMKLPAGPTEGCTAHRREMMPTFSADDPTAEERLVVIAFVPPIPVFLLLELYCASLDPHARGEYHVRTHFKGIRWNLAAGKVSSRRLYGTTLLGRKKRIGPGISEPNSKRGVVGQLHPLSAVAMCEVENCWNSDGQTLVETAVSLTILFSMVFGLINVGMALYSYNFVAESEREGSRYAMVRGSCGISPLHRRDQRTC